MERARFIPNHQARLLWGGRAYLDLLIHLVERARTCIHLQVYIYEADATGELVADTLIAAAKRGVAVYVLVETVGSFNVNDLSARVSIELNIDLQGDAVVQQAVADMVKIIESDCERITHENVKQKINPLARFKQWCAFRALRLLFFLGTFYMRQERPG